MKFLILFFLPWLLHAGSVNLINDSPYNLRVVVRAADGTYLGEMILSAGHSGTWSDFTNFNPNGMGLQQSPYSQTPYSVIWSCLDSKEFSVCDNISPGATCTAFTCPGLRSCETKKPPRPKAPGDQSYEIGPP